MEVIDNIAFAIMVSLLIVCIVASMGICWWAVDHAITVHKEHVRKKKESKVQSKGDYTTIRENLIPAFLNRADVHFRVYNHLDVTTYPKIQGMYLVYCKDDSLKLLYHNSIGWVGVEVGDALGYILPSK